MTHLNLQFIHTPYEFGVSLRADVYARQFSVVVSGTTTYPEDDLNCGTYTREETFSVCTGAELNDVISQVIEINQRRAWAFRNEDKDYYDAELGHDCGPVSFLAQSVCISDRLGRKVLGGCTRHGEIFWITPVKDNAEAAKLHQHCDALHAEAALESGWDNFSTAKALRREARQLLLADVAPFWRQHPEVLALMEPELFDVKDPEVLAAYAT
ncbi:hypothetical protein PCO86_05310 [Pectobacteriaceae bacterium CE70]|nr:hypothetical protein PCO87_05150 [Pectobacteriaceae bacterium C52]WJV67848.1 hypothetical protein PCO86_05310 [Pectobacteriaceae bacterium CE70]WJY11791.1 hypothetical protein PCO80_05125 [Pectobacteriaceae bacterium C80]